MVEFLKSRSRAVYFFTRRWILTIHFCSMLQNHPESWVIWGHTAMCSETPSNRHSVEARLYQRISRFFYTFLCQICAVASSAKHKTSTFCHHQVPSGPIRLHEGTSGLRHHNCGRPTALKAVQSPCDHPASTLITHVCNVIWRQRGEEMETDGFL